MEIEVLLDASGFMWHLLSFLPTLSVWWWRFFSQKQFVTTVPNSKAYLGLSHRKWIFTAILFTLDIFVAKNPKRTLDASNTSIVGRKRAEKGLSTAVIIAKAPFLNSFTVK